MSGQSSGRVEPDAVRGIRLKLARAQPQLDHIEDLTNAYWKRKPMLPFGEFNSDSTEYTLQLRIVEAPDILWGVLFGEAINNMRSALDHAIDQLTIAYKGKPMERTGFPIFADKVAFNAKGEPQIRGVAPAVHAYIEGLQPHNDPKPKDTHLWTLQDSWNQDKHRVILLMAALPNNASITVHPAVPCNIQVFDGLKEDGAQLAYITFTEPSPHVQVRLEATMQIFDKNGWDGHLEATITYEEALDQVSEIVGRLFLYR